MELSSVINTLRGGIRTRRVAAEQINMMIRPFFDTIIREHSKFFDQT